MPLVNSFIIYQVFQNNVGNNIPYNNMLTNKLEIFSFRKHDVHLGKHNNSKIKKFLRFCWRLHEVVGLPEALRTLIKSYPLKYITFPRMIYFRETSIKIDSDSEENLKGYLFRRRIKTKPKHVMLSHYFRASKIAKCCHA